MKLFLVVYFLTIVSVLGAQPLSYEQLHHKGFGYQTSSQIKNSNERSSIKSFYRSVLGIKTIEDVDNCNDRIDFNKFYSYGFSNLIRHKADEYDIIAINENHLIPQHRYIASKLLYTLYEKGYRHIAVEGLSVYDTLINERKYPQFMTSGFYLRDPSYSKFLRKAMGMGFELIAYDMPQSDEREYDSATNICDHIFSRNIKKMLIYCGHEHVNEAPTSTFSKTIVMYLKEFLSKEIYTISQTELSCIEMSFPDICFENSIVFKNREYENKYLKSISDESDVDISIFSNVNGVYYKFFDDEVKHCTIDHSNVKNFLVLAFDENEPNNPVPWDIIEVKDGKMSRCLMLRKNLSYTIKYIGSTGVIYTNSIKI